MDSLRALALPVDAPQEQETEVAPLPRGDEEAFQEIYELYRERIWALVVYSIGDSLQAQDILQAIFLKVFRGLRSFKRQSSFFTWIYRIALNECRNHQRRRRARHVPLEAIIGSRDEIDPKAIPNHREIREVLLQNAVRQLTYKMQDVVVLKYLQGLSYEEMSRVLGCSPGTVASRLNRALGELEERLRPFRRFL